MTGKYDYIEGPGQRYVGLADVLLWLTKKAAEASEAYLREQQRNASYPVMDQLWGKKRMAMDLVQEFMELHNMNTADTFKGSM